MSIQQVTHNKTHIDYIDLAKGICITLVVVFHISGQCQIELEVNGFFSLFRMPLYYILSGLFFKQYSGFLEFFKRKMNKLMIPFLFFYITTSIILYFVLIEIGDNSLQTFADKNVDGWTPFLGFWYESFFNIAIWFLLCLFWINILFYLLLILSRRYLALFVASLGLLFFYVSKSINIPLFIDSAITNMPFFYFGYYLKNRTSFLFPNKYDKYNHLTIVVAFCLLLIMFYFKDSFESRLYLLPIHYYVSGIIGTITILLLSKKIDKLYPFSYFGRYSIIILCTHIVIFRLAFAFFHKFTGNNWLLFWSVFLVTTSSYFIIIPLFRKYLPHVTAQKDLIKIK